MIDDLPLPENLKCPHCKGNWFVRAVPATVYQQVKKELGKLVLGYTKDVEEEDEPRIFCSNCMAYFIVPEELKRPR